MAPLIVVTGPPGAGKSTVSALLAERFDRSALVEGDAFFAFVKQGWVEPWLKESAEQNEVVIRAAAAAAGRLAAAGYTTVYDGVLGPWFLPAFVEATGLASIDYAVLLPSEDECVRRVVTRQDHAFADESATRKMHAEFAEAVIDERHVLRDVGEPEEVVDRILDVLPLGTLRVTPGQ